MESFNASSDFLRTLMEQSLSEIIHGSKLFDTEREIIEKQGLPSPTFRDVLEISNIITYYLRVGQNYVRNKL